MQLQKFVSSATWPLKFPYVKHCCTTEDISGMKKRQEFAFCEKHQRKLKYFEFSIALQVH